MKMNKYLGLMLVLFSISACSINKYVPEGEHLFVKAEVEINSDTIPQRYIEPLGEELESLLRPQPNRSFLGMRPQLYIYSIIDSPRNENSIKGWLKYQVGEAPVYLRDVNREYNENLLRNRLENLGFFQAQVTSDTTLNEKKASITYYATPHIVYRIRSVEFEVDSSTEIGRAIVATKEESLLQPGRPFNLSHIISERERIDNELKNLGYYYFSPDYMLVDVDSAGGDHHVDLYLTIKRETPQRALEKYYINNIVIYPDYTLNQSGYRRFNPRQAELYKGQYYFVDPDYTYRRFALASTMFFKPGDYYNRNSHSRTLNQLVNMGTFRFVKNDFLDVDSGKNLLDVHYYLTPMPKKGLRIELLAKTASIYNGTELNVNWTNRNAFKSGELLTISVFGGYETQTGGNVNLNSSFYRYGIQADLTFPRIIAPFDWQASRRYTPKTFFRAGYEFLNRRTAYSLNSLNFSTGYFWRESLKKEHQLALLEIGYVQAQNISENYQAQMDTIPSLRHTVEPQFTFGPTYTFTYTNTMDQERRHTYFFRGGLDLSANTYGLIKGANWREGRVYQIFNANFSQYIKTEADFRHYMKLGRNTVLASRAMLGFGYSYGNSRSLPYVKQFYSGGPNGLRGFRARAVGPGSHVPEYLGENNFFPDQTGDIKMEFNTELRAKIVSIIDYGVFLDMGNVWLQNSAPDKPGAQFSGNFLNEFAVSGGVGLRFDLSFLILRTDFGIPLRLPHRPEGQRWVFNEIDFGNKAWRRDNLVFNLAIGYPF